MKNWDDVQIGDKCAAVSYDIFDRKSVIRGIVKEINPNSVWIEWKSDLDSCFLTKSEYEKSIMFYETEQEYLSILLKL